MGTHATELEVVEKALVADDVVHLRLAAPDGGRLPEWTPGAHIGLALPVGQRLYSLCGSRWDAFSYEIAVLRERARSGGSAFIHDTLRTGERVAVSGPLNNFPVIPAERYLFIAGGIGITPLRAMIDQVQRTGTAWHLVYGGRTRSAMAFAADLQKAYGERVEICPQDDVGPLDLGSALAWAEPGTVVYSCGPEPLLAAVTERCGSDPRRVRTERFSARAGSRADARPFDIVLARSERRLTVPATSSLLDVLTEAGADVQGACLEGACGSCGVGVLAGDVDHRDLIRGAGVGEDSVMYPCVSRARSSELVLDL